jgi:hypothetical protein
MPTRSGSRALRAMTDHVASSAAVKEFWRLAAVEEVEEEARRCPQAATVRSVAFHMSVFDLVAFRGGTRYNSFAADRD